MIITIYVLATFMRTCILFSFDENIHPASGPEAEEGDNKNLILRDCKRI